MTMISSERPNIVCGSSRLIQAALADVEPPSASAEAGRLAARRQRSARAVTPA